MVATLVLMPKKKDTPAPPGVAKPDDRKRSAIFVPRSWAKVMNQLRAEKKMPALWLVIDMMIERANAVGIKNLPKAPWEEGYSEKDETP